MLLFRSPIAYVNFSLWIWGVTPFVRRVLDQRHGWNPTNPVLIAPPLVALISALALVRYVRELRSVLYAPYLLVLTALTYGYAVGLISAGVFPATYGLITWLAPVVFGIHVAVRWRRFPELRESLQRTFMIALPILAAYGVYQFARLPSWDAAWMRNADLKSLGSPLPFLVRVFGTLNTPGPFAAFLVGGILIMLGAKGILRYPSIAVALIALLLTRTRAAWVAFLIGLVVQQLSQPIIRLPKRTITLFAVVLLALPIAATPKFRNSILPRLTTLADIRDDKSFIKRVEFSTQTANTIVETAEGDGLGSTGGAIKLRGMQGVRSLDNGFLEVFYVFGWPGGTTFFLGIGALLLQSLRFAEARRDAFAGAARATAIALVSILPIGDVFTGPTGTLLWTMVGLGITSHGYHLTTGLALRSRQLSLSPAPGPFAVTPPAGAAPARA